MWHSRNPLLTNEEATTILEWWQDRQVTDPTDTIRFKKFLESDGSVQSYVQAYIAKVRVQYQYYQSTHLETGLSLHRGCFILSAIAPGSYYQDTTRMPMSPVLY